MKDEDRSTGFNLLLDKKIELYEGLIRLSKNQTRSIFDEEWDDLQSLIRKKEDLINRISKLDKILKPAIEKFKEVYELRDDFWVDGLQETGKLPENIKEKLKQLLSSLKELQKIDNKNRLLIKEERMKMKKGMMKIQHGHKLNKGYNNMKRIYSSFIDKRS